MSHSALVDALVSQYSWPAGVVTYAFSDAGVATYKGGYAGGSDTTSAWSDAQKAVVRAIYDDVSDFAGLVFSDTGNTATANIELQIVESVPGGWAGYAGYPSTYWGSTLVVGNQYLQPGSNGNGNVMVHEIGHALGLEHTHDGANSFPDLAGSSDRGDFDLNSGLSSVMSYNSPYDPAHPELWITGDQTSFMALDIAALQEIYGTSAHATTDSAYGLASGLQSIWDTGGTDVIDFGDAIYDAVIDLRAATLLNEVGGAGYLSFVYGQASNYSTAGGYTIANGVSIENATGGGGNDEITGNDLANVLKGNGGNDRLNGGGGADTLMGGGGRDTIKGEKGNDLLEGGGGRDKLIGGGGKDILAGEGGNDKLKGGKGADQFVFAKGGDRDTIRDFADDVDQIRITGLGSTSEVLARASDVGSDVVFDFGGGDVLTVQNMTLAQISDDILI